MHLQMETHKTTYKIVMSHIKMFESTYSSSISHHGDAISKIQTMWDKEQVLLTIMKTIYKNLKTPNIKGNL